MAAIPASFRKHGAFVYEVPETIAHYGSSQAAVAAMVNAQMTHAWVRIHNSQAPYNTPGKQAIAAFIAQLGAAGIAVAGWGWCQGTNPAADANLAGTELAFFGLSDYIADIEHGVHGANWTAAEITQFCTLVRPNISGSFGVTTFPLIDWHEPQLMKAALPFVDMFNPQVYWHRYPDQNMVNQFPRPGGGTYQVHKPADYAALCLDRWDKLMAANPKPIVMTGQAYWGEGKPPFTQTEAEDKLDQFLAAWSSFNRIIGLNWWHLGGSKAMSSHMLSAITNTQLGSKPYKT